MSYRFNRRRRSDDQHGVDDWLMTYADMITLLLCFFAVFLSVSVPKKEVFQKAREKVLEQFADPSDMTSGKFPTTPGTNRTGGMNDALPSIIDRYNSSDAENDSHGLDGAQQAKENENIATDDSQYKKPEGDRIITMEMPSAAFFDSGSATLNEDGKKLLDELADTQLKTDAFRDYVVTVEGHTDDAPIRTVQFPSNWELSTARSAAVVRYFIENGINPQRLRAAGYADSFPKLPNRDSLGRAIPDNQRQNRRVVIKLERIEPSNRE